MVLHARGTIVVSATISRTDVRFEGQRTPSRPMRASGSLPLHASRHATGRRRGRVLSSAAEGWGIEEVRKAARGCTAIPARITDHRTHPGTRRGKGCFDPVFPPNEPDGLRERTTRRTGRKERGEAGTRRTLAHPSGRQPGRGDRERPAYCESRGRSFPGGFRGPSLDRWH